MKFINSSRVRTLASTLLCLFAFGSASFAGTLSYPRGLAVDSKGNLYVANSGANNIVVYSPKYVQETGKTITSNIINPTGVAFDAAGNLWVANYGTSNGGQNGSIAEYTGGKQNTSASITNGILGPGALAVDGAGNVWVVNDFTNVTVYAPGYVFTAPNTLVRTLNTGTVYGISVADGVLAWGGNGAVSFGLATLSLIDGSTAGDYYYSNDTGFALAADSKGNVYMANLNGSVNVASNQNSEYGLVQLSFQPSGIAIDNARGRVYIANYNGNSISVYSTAGQLLTVIK
jgi:sugar lactone lactonase YvrE